MVANRLLIGLGVVVSLACCGDDEGGTPRRDVGPNWMHHGMLAGLPAYVGMPDVELNKKLDALVDQHVDVVIADSALSNYMFDEPFKRQMELISKVTAATHRRGMKIVWYLTSLEVQTVNGRLSVNSMYKDHPDWVQIGIDGKPNVFFGNKEDWVEPDDESAWLCPISPYRDYFLERIKLLAATGVDGIWADVPAYMDTGSGWACACPRHRAHFKKTTGLTLGDAKDWTNEAFRRWVPYRHRELAEFQRAIYDAARSVNPEIETIMEIFSTDTLDGTETGLDATFMGNQKGISHVWEIDSVSNTHGMLYSSQVDWFNKITITKFAKGADKGRPTWVFAYGNTDWDATMVFATAVASQANPYETKSPNMATSVGPELRKRLFSWIEPHKATIYDAKPAARVALLYSAHTRDYVDNMYGFGLFADYIPRKLTEAGKPKPVEDKTWWETDVVASAGSTEFLGEYRGFAFALGQLHVPFVIETMQHQTKDTLSRYDLLIAPDFAALSDEQARMLGDYVKEGGSLLITGPRPSTIDDVGKTRGELALAEILGFKKAAIPPAEATHVHHVGKGRVTHVNAWPGRRYLRVQSDLALETIERVVRQSARRLLETDADWGVYVDLYRTDDKLVLHAINLVGLDGSGKSKPTTQQPTITLRLPTGKSAASATLSTPDAPGQDKTLQLEQPGPGLARLKVPVENYSLVVVKLEDKGPAAASLKASVTWPKGASALGMTVRVVDESSLTSRAAHLTGGSSGALIDELSAGERTASFTTWVNGQAVGVIRRGVKLSAGKQAEVAVAPGVNLESGPTKVDARQHDRLLFYNPSKAAVDLTVDGAKVSVPAGGAVGHVFAKTGAIAFSSAKLSGTVTVTAQDTLGAGRAPAVDKLSATSGYAGHSLELVGKRFGAFGSVTWGASECVVRSWSDDLVVVSLPSDAAPGGHPIVVHAGGASKPRTFTVKASQVTRTKAIEGAFTFMKAKMTSKYGGVYTNFVDVEDPPDATLVYPNGHHQTAEHTGLMLWISAALLDHENYEKTFRFIRDRMVSPRRGIVNWAVDKKTDVAMLQEGLNANAPLDDFRVVKAMFAGYDLWKDRRYLEVALRIGRGLFETSVSDDYDKYTGGVIAYGHNWREDRGVGKTDADPIPVDYTDLYAIRRLSEHDRRWQQIYDSGVKFLEDSQIASSGQFWNSFTDEKFSGDFEYPKTIAGSKIKTIQSLWIAIHLARVGRKASARKALEFYKTFYRKHKRIAEYYNPDGTEPTSDYFKKKLKKGEPRIYGQVARLALYMGGADDVAFAKQVIKEKLESDLVTTGPVAGHIGKSAEEPGNANAYNSLESLLALAFAEGAKAVSAKYE